MSDGGCFGGIFDSIEGGERRRFIRLKQARQCLLFGFSNPSKDTLVDPSIHETTNAPCYAVQRTKSGKLAVCDEQCFDSGIDQIGRVLHHLSCCMHGLCGDMSSMFALAIEFQML